MRQDNSRAIVALSIGAVAVCLIAFWLVGRDGDETVIGEQILSEENVGSETGPRRKSDAAEDGTTPASATADKTLPKPVDLSQADRDLDLFGIVVDERDRPVAGANVRTFTQPWRRASGLFMVDNSSRFRFGRSTRSAADGTFAIRLARGAMVSLLVTASGFGDAEIASCQAGERVGVTMRPEASLAVECVDERGAPVSGVSLSFWRAERNENPTHYRFGESNQEGKFTFTGLTTGTSPPLPATRRSSEPRNGSACSSHCRHHD